MHFEGKTPCHVIYHFHKHHMVFHVVMWWYSKDVILVSTIVVFIQAHVCFHGTRSIQCMYDHGCPYLGMCFRSMSGQMQDPASWRCGQSHVTMWRHNAFHVSNVKMKCVAKTDLPLIKFKMGLCWLQESNHKTDYITSILKDNEFCDLIFLLAIVNIWWHKMTTNITMFIENLFHKWKHRGWMGFGYS